MKRSVPLIFVLTVLTACAVSPTGRHQLRLVSDSEMSQMGVTAFQQMKEKTPATKNARTSAYVQCVAHALTAQVPRSALTPANRSEEHTSELQSLMRISYDVFCLKKKTSLV